MGTALLLVVALMLPTAVGYGVVLAVRWRRWVLARRPPAPAEPIEHLGAALRRLHAELDRTESAQAMPAKKVRRDAVRAAYVDALSAACRRFDVPPPAAHGTAAVPLTEIYRAEAALRSCGLDVNPRS